MTAADTDGTDTWVPSVVERGVHVVPLGYERDRIVEPERHQHHRRAEPLTRAPSRVFSSPGGITSSREGPVYTSVTVAPSEVLVTATIPSGRSIRTASPPGSPRLSRITFSQTTFPVRVGRCCRE